MLRQEEVTTCPWTEPSVLSGSESPASVQEFQTIIMREYIFSFVNVPTSTTAA
jgi:hypothetical protein